MPHFFLHLPLALSTLLVIFRCVITNAFGTIACMNDIAFNVFLACLQVTALNETTLNIEVKNESVVPNFEIIHSLPNSVAVVFFPSDIVVEVMLLNSSNEFYYLNIRVYLPASFDGFASGLLGNFNGNVSDDFVFLNGTILNDSASDGEIHLFCQSCKYHDI